MFLTQDALRETAERFGFTFTYTEATLSAALKPRDPNANIPQIDLFWPDNGEPGFDCRIRVSRSRKARNPLELLRFITAFNWDCLTGKLIMNQESGEIALQLYYHNAPERIDSEDFAIDFLMGCHLARAIQAPLSMVVGGQCNAVKALALLETKLEEQMADIHRNAHAADCECSECRNEEAPDAAVPAVSEEAPLLTEAEQPPSVEADAPVPKKNRRPRRKKPSAEKAAPETTVSKPSPSANPETDVQAGKGPEAAETAVKKANPRRKTPRKPASSNSSKPTPEAS